VNEVEKKSSQSWKLFNRAEIVSLERDRPLKSSQEKPEKESAFVRSA
jgi:hypothetical protein